MVIMRVLIDSENGEPMWVDEVMEMTEEVLKELVECEEFKQLSKEFYFFFCFISRFFISRLMKGVPQPILSRFCFI